MQNKSLVFITKYQLLISLCLINNVSVFAKDFGVRGHTYSIFEQPFLQMIDDRLKKVDMEVEKDKMEQVVRDRVDNPAAVKNMQIATKDRIFYFDPTYTLDEDAVLPCGKILHRAGTKVNPLEYMDLNRRLFFIDARESKQISWLKNQLNNPLPEQKEPIEDRIILVGGSVLKLKQEIKQNNRGNVYFDQNGELAAKFGIKHSPAIVVQDGLLLKIEEVALLKILGQNR